jgi:hypothetical protein
MPARPQRTPRDTTAFLHATAHHGQEPAAFACIPSLRARGTSSRAFDRCCRHTLPQQGDLARAAARGSSGHAAHDGIRDEPGRTRCATGTGKLATKMASIYKPFHFYVSTDVPLELKVFVAAATLPATTAAAIAAATGATTGTAAASAAAGPGRTAVHGVNVDGDAAAGGANGVADSAGAAAAGVDDGAGSGAASHAGRAREPAAPAAPPSAALIPASMSLGVAAALHPEALFITVQAVDGGVPLHSAARATQLPHLCGNRIVWNEWLALPVKVRDLSLTAQLVRAYILRGRAVCDLRVMRRLRQMVGGVVSSLAPPLRLPPPTRMPAAGGEAVGPGAHAAGWHHPPLL